MDRQTLIKVDFFVLAWGVVICTGAAIFWGEHVLQSAVIGSVLGYLNWAAFRFAGVRMAALGNRQRFGIFLAVKSFAILGAVLIILYFKLAEPIPFVVGLSSLVFGVLTRGGYQAFVEGNAALREGQ